MKPKTPTTEPYGQKPLMDVEKVYHGPESGTWVDCKICGLGHAETPTSKGFCHDCRRERQFIKALADRIVGVENKLDALIALQKGKE